MDSTHRENRKPTRQEQQLSFQNQPRKNYFEGWYFKQVSGDESVILSLIPSMMRSNHQERAMLQVILAEQKGESWEIQTDRLDAPMSAFQSTQHPFSVTVGENRFSKQGLSLALRTPSVQVEGALSFGAFTDLPTTAWAPTIMGPFSYLPFMECIHGIGSLHHVLRGTLQINGRTVSFDEGIGYIEKDWGHSFPKSYVWLQSNHFAQRPSCLFFSWANIPLGPFQFPGFICHLWMNGQHHRFATYNRTVCRIHEMTEDRIRLTLKRGDESLDIQAGVYMKGTLAAPKHGQMDHQIKEGLAGTVAFQFRNEATGEVLEDRSSLAGVEIVPALEKKSQART